MRSAPVLVAAVALGILTFSATREAHALGPIGVEAGAKVGVAGNPFNNNSPFSQVNPAGFGLGGRAGVTFLGLYGGLSAMYYFGSSKQLASVPGSTASVSAHSDMYGIEAGYGVSLLGLMTLRGQVGVGNATYTGSGGITGIGGGSSSVNNLYVEPGVTALVSVAGYFIGADANLLFLPGANDTTTGFTIHGQIGLSF